MLDPQDAKAGHSSKSVQGELQEMLDFVERQCEAILSHLPD